MEIITSKDNPLVKKAALLIENKKQREREKAFVAEGARFCREAALSGQNILSVFMTEEFYSQHNEDAKLIEKSCNNLKFISQNISQKLSNTVTPQGVFCICEIKEKNIDEISGNKYIALENLQDPGNIGTVIRTAEAFGMDGVLIFDNCADIYNSKVLRSTMGTIFRIPIYRIDTISAMHFLKKNGYEIFGAVVDSRQNKLSDMSFPEKSVCIIGNEANGLKSETVDMCDTLVYIDMPGNAESLNASVAASVIMWEMSRRQ